MKKKKVVIFTVISVVALVIITLGVTYAFFNYLRQGTTENTISSGSINFIYDEVDKKGNGINLVDALPISDTEGKAQTNGFNFKIVSKASDTISIPYEITLRKKLGSDNIDNIVKVYLAKTVDNNTTVANEEEVVTSLYSSLTDTTHNGYSEKVLYTSVVPASNSEYNQGYRLKMWIDENTDYSPVNGEYPYENKTFTVMVNVYSNGKTLTEVSKRANISTVALGNTPITAQPDGSYVTVLPEGTTETTINVETENPYSQVTITKTDSTYTNPIAVSKKVSVNKGNNYFKISVKSEDGKVTNNVHLNIQVGVLTLGEMIIEDALSRQNNTIYTNPTLTASSNNTQDPNGLYSIEVTNGFGGTDGTTYYFRGNVTNNYVSFAENLWRVVRVNEDGTIRLILNSSAGSSRYLFNSKQDSTSSTYADLYYSNSDTLKSAANSWYTTNIDTPGYAAKIATGNYFCEALKVTQDSYFNTGAASPLLYTNYTPNFKCENDGNLKGLLDYNIGLLTYDEIVFAGYYYNSINREVYLTGDFNWWSMNSLGLTNKPWYWYVSGDFGYSGLSNEHCLRPVINLKANVTATGTGTELDPYVIQ